MWLKDNNVLYKDIVINLDLINTCEREFVFAGISSRVLQCNKDIQEKKGYTADLKADNFENDLYYVASNAKIGDSSLLSDCLYTTINNT